MKLLFLTEFFPQDEQKVFTGGVEARTYYLVNRAKKDFVVKVVSSTSQQIPATPLSVFSRALYLFVALFKALKSDFDLIEASNVVTYLPAYLAAKIKKRPVIIWIPDVLGKAWFEFGWFVGLFGFVMERICLKLSWDGVIALSESTKTKLIAAKIKTNHLTVVHGGIEPNEFKQTVHLPKFAKPTICCVARLVKTKRINVLIKAVSLLDNLPNLRLLIIGRGPQKKHLLKLIQEFRLTKKAKIIDYLPRQELIDTLYRSQVFCLPSVVEGFGLATIEAMACGLPAILAGIPVNQEITNFGQGTLFFKADNESDLSQKISQLFTRPQLYRQKQLEALKLAKTYTWEKAYLNTKKFYETCLSL
ncbi:glycosyltransferase family 4 protein [Patescibacteria group bacterium]|nr:glycosyltransferase family 4 protein [Patescibacteria group bacterium]MBU1499472.1 glycosyltransferase family 4 protein [Patescibacteria group bacterium]